MIFDLESDGLLLKDVTKIHVLSYRKGSRIKHTFDYDKMREVLSKAKVLIGHNIIRYDIPVIEKILGIKIKAQLIDTLALSWYLNHKYHIHGLEHYGVRYGVPKPKIDDWQNLSKEEYAHRCDEDVKINTKVWDELKEKLLYLYETKDQADRLIRYLSFKMNCAREQERSGWKLDVEKAQRHRDELFEKQEEIVQKLKSVMPSVVKYRAKTPPKKPFKKDGTLSAEGAKWNLLLKENNLPKDYKGSIDIPTRTEEPNPNSTDQIKDWLFSLGWEPENFDFKKEDDGSERKVPQVRVEDEEGNKDLCPSVYKLAEKQPEINLLKSLSVIQHRLGLFKGFLNNHIDGWVKAEINGLTNTLRFKHKIIVNLPGVDKAWGKEIRGCLIAPEGYTLCGADVVSLEDSTKKHFMWDYDPEFVIEMSKKGFDPHLDLAKFAGVISQDSIDKYVGLKVSAKKGEKLSKSEKEFFKNTDSLRKQYKAANYACTYGVGKVKLARTLEIPTTESLKLIETYWERNWSVKKLSEELFTKTYKGETWLYNPVSKFYYSLRSEKDRFSTLNQGTGVYCFDTWIREFRKRRSQLTAQFHDEIISCLKQGFEEKYEALLKNAMSTVNKLLKLNITLDVDVQFGSSYAEIH